MPQTIRTGYSALVDAAEREIETLPVEQALALFGRIDPEIPYHKPIFAADKRFVLFCAGGLRSALAAQTAHRMGLRPVAHIKGGFVACRKASGPLEPPTAKPKSA
jgi:rhodanese-related sulfurtransferase